jgi:hypothetical protein
MSSNRVQVTYILTLGMEPSSASRITALYTWIGAAKVRARPATIPAAIIFVICGVVFIFFMILSIPILNKKRTLLT